MRSGYVKIGLLFSCLLLVPIFLVVSAEAEPSSPVPAGPVVTLRVESGTTIAFKPHNGRTTQGVPPQTVNLPHLVLFRNGVLTDPAERTLIVAVTGIKVPPPGVTVTLELTTQHGDPDRGGGNENRIPVWRESQRLANSSGLAQSGITAVFTHEFNATVRSGTQTIATPTDYFRYEFNRLGLIITRPDANESSDPVGAYTIVLQPGG